MTISPQRYLVLLYSLVGVLVLLDQLTKIIVKSSLALGESVNVIGAFLRLTLLYNDGGAFSTQLGPTLFYTIISACIAGVLIYLIYRHSTRDRLVALALAIVASGALGNLIDRIYLNSVIDWIDFEFFNIHIAPGKFLFWQHSGYHLTRWPVFNVADAAVTVGIVLLIFHVLFRRSGDQDADPQTES